MATAQPRPTGLLSNARFVASPNHNARPAGAVVSLLVIHNISLPPGQFGTGCVEQFFCNQLDWQAHPYFKSIEGLEVSAHCLIERSGALIQFVSLHQRAWHAGRSSFEGLENCNDFSIGIELEGTDDQPYSDAQYESLVQVTLQLQQNFLQLTNARIVGHCDIAPGRKTDPGPAFDWVRFRTQLLDAQSVIGELR
uniref:1,6-anhydro-N-acetylmuramyl-L-alanine amidase AmpD n=1 Tax=Marinobacterium profundum TaxID=1714300 RepID=UPI0008309AD2|nr:1,6-anhydro-N-acetylmuramyl-L-alanine amidase AmpD [Marinobacterium profundum]